MDDWDPAVIDAIAAERPVILFDNAGIGLSTGETPDSVKGMADKAAEFIRLLGFTQVDLLGFSLGGYVAQTVTLNYPDTWFAGLCWPVPVRAVAKESWWPDRRSVRFPGVRSWVLRNISSCYSRPRKKAGLPHIGAGSA
jgi:pimeloyl-ACP methyl ester carboxylesterase